jgi:hypothetical protein
VSKTIGQNRWSKGLQLEKAISKKLHTRASALLVSPLFLRDQGLGQIDLAVWEKGEIRVFEIKSQHQPNIRQLTRLRKACHFLGLLFEATSRLEVIDASECQEF